MSGRTKKQKYFLSESYVVFINQNATFLKVCNLSDKCIVSKKKKKFVCYYSKAHGPSFDLYIYIWVGPPRGAHGEETHPPLVGLQFSSLIHKGFLQYKLFKKPSPNRCGTRGFVFKRLYQIFQLNNLKQCNRKLIHRKMGYSLLHVVTSNVPLGIGF